MALAVSQRLDLRRELPSDPHAGARVDSGLRGVAFVMLRTVETHLSNANGKLRISAREQLAAALSAG